MKAKADRDRETVKRAARLMDRKLPGWFRRIVFKRLDLRDSDNCICGQTGLRWDVMEDELEAMYPEASVAAFADNNVRKLWIDEIRTRRAKARA